MKKIIILLSILSLLFLTGCDRERNYKSTYLASGIVIDEQNEPLADVLINFDDQYSVSTDAAGQWQRSGLEGEIRVEPSREGYSFSPQILKMSEHSQKEDLCFNASKIKKYYSVSGLILDQNQQPIPGVSLDFGDDFAAVKTDSSGRWQKSGLEGEVTVTPSLYDWQFSPANITLSEAESEADDISFRARHAENYGYYSLSGQIIDDSGQGAAAVVIKITNADNGELLDTVITDAEGQWSASRVWGRVEITADPNSKAEISAFKPKSHQKAGESENVDFKAEEFKEL